MRGSCLCGAAVYEVDRLAGAIGHCHCTRCRKAHAAAFATTARVDRAHFRRIAGEATIAAFESSPGKLRHFCARCGTHLVAEWVAQPQVIVRVATLDDDPGARAVVHIWTSHDVPWLEHEGCRPSPRRRPRDDAPVRRDLRDGMNDFLAATEVVDWTHPAVLARARALAAGTDEVEGVARACVEWVRDAIAHTGDAATRVVTCAASEVLEAGSGYCYAKSHLLAALLRANGIPAGFSYQPPTERLAFGVAAPGEADLAEIRPAPLDVVVATLRRQSGADARTIELPDLVLGPRVGGEKPADPGR